MAILQVHPWAEASWWHHGIEAPLTRPRTPRLEASSSADSTSTTSMHVRAVVMADEERACAVLAARDAECRLLDLLHVLMWRNSKASVSLEPMPTP